MSSLYKSSLTYSISKIAYTLEEFLIIISLVSVFPTKRFENYKFFVDNDIKAYFPMADTLTTFGYSFSNKRIKFPTIAFASVGLYVN